MDSPNNDNLNFEVHESTLRGLTKYLRLTNYLSAAQLYLRNNFLLEEPLQREHIKKRILGHWGTVPGINFIYATLNLMIKEYERKVMLVTGPGHGYPALLANLFLEGTLGDTYPDYVFSEKGWKRLIRDFSWPGGFPSHANPETPGAILEGGELGYSLGTAFGAAFDNPNLLVACIIGDGEAETGPLAASWQSTKFLNPIQDGAVLPILHLNHHKISGPTLLGSMDVHELIAYFRGLNYEPVVISIEKEDNKLSSLNIINGSTNEDNGKLFSSALSGFSYAFQKIQEIQTTARTTGKFEKPRWPVIIFSSPKGWTGPQDLGGLPIEGSYRSHGIPLENPLSDDAEFEALQKWLSSYSVTELVSQDFKLDQEIAKIIPPERLQMGRNPHANGGTQRKKLILPSTKDYAQFIPDPGKVKTSNTVILSNYLKDIIKSNLSDFRIFSPDEIDSNKFSSLFNVTTRVGIWPPPFGSDNIAQQGRVMEILSEHVLMSWMQGYVLTGRHGIFITYEAFGMIVASMIDQYIKFLLQMEKISWREPIASLNIILTSTTWRQDHNGFSHQNPSLISDLLHKHSNKVHLHFPVDANMLVATMEECLERTNGINVIVADKRDLPQYLSPHEAKKQMETGISHWEWIGDKEGTPDLIYAATGDHATKEALFAVKIMNDSIPELNIKFVSVSELTFFGIGDNEIRSSLSKKEVDAMFPGEAPILYSYHGYPEDIKFLIFNHDIAKRTQIFGYTERGTTTTPFDMLVKNGMSRFDLVINGLSAIKDKRPELELKIADLINMCEALLAKHSAYIREEGDDMPEVTEASL